jgi:hypothetical protein
MVKLWLMEGVAGVVLMNKNVYLSPLEVNKALGGVHGFQAHLEHWRPQRRVRWIARDFVGYARSDLPA